MTKLDELKDMLRDWRDTSSLSIANEICVYLMANLRLPKREPILKNEKIRKAVRAWADMNELKHVVVWADDTFASFYDHRVKITFSHCVIPPKGIQPHTVYNIDELCGEEDL